TSYLFHNEGNSNRWLSVVCVGRASNRSGLGAKVRVQAKIAGGTRWQLRDINSGSGYGSARPRGHFGLGDATNVDLVRIEWPSGIIQELHNVAPNQILTVEEPLTLAAMGKTTADTAFLLTLKGRRGEPCTIEQSSDLIHWSTLTNFVAIQSETVI